MNRDSFLKLIQEGPLLLDGATGSNLILAGMPRGVNTEKWVLEHPEVIIELQKAYVEAGSKAVYAPSFTANRISLTEAGLADMIQRMNTELPALSKKAVGDRALVAGDMTTVGRLLEPRGVIAQDDLFDAYAEQAKYLVDAGVDFIIGETLIYAEEAMVMVDAIQSVSDIAICISFSVEGDGTLPLGGHVLDAVLQLEQMGVAAAGINCSMGPDQALSVVRQLKENLSIPVIAKLNAGMPDILDDGTVAYSMDVEQYAGYMDKILDAGADLIGGCCGTTPAYVAALNQLIEKRAGGSVH